MASKKQYGLILPGKSKPPLAAVVPTPKTAQKSKNVFGDDSSDDEESNVDWVKQSLKKQSHGSMQQKQSMKVMKQALEDDPSVYAYDEVYDEMERKKEEVKEQRKGDKKPKYIENLLKTAKQRELENELRKERLAQKEREDEGDMFQDKEAFVTSAYKKKMEELRKMQDDQAYNDAVDDVTEVTKQKDMSGFYRYLYREKMKEEPSVSETKTSNEADTTTEDKSPSIKQEPSESPVLDKESLENSTKPKDEELHHKIKVEPKEKDEERRHRDPGGEERSHNNRRRRSRSGSHSRDRKRRHESPQDNKRRDFGRDRRERSRSRDRFDRRRDDRHRRSRSRERGRGRDDKRTHSSKPSHRSPDRYFNRDRDDKDKSRKERNSPERSSKNPKPSSSNAKIKIVQKENWYDFDVEIQRNVKKSFYAKRTVGKAFDEALQRYLIRKSTNEVAISK